MDITLKNHEIKGAIPKGIKYEKPRLLIDRNTVFEETLKINMEDDNNETLEIIVGESTEIKIILEVSSQEKSEHTYHLNLIAKPNSKVTYLLISDLNSEKGLIEHTFKAHKDAQLELLGGFVSNKLKAKMRAELLEQNAYVNMRAVGVSSFGNDQTIDIELIHMAPHTTGFMHNIAIANGDGRVILNGVEKILKGNNGSDAYQSLKGIIASDDAVIEVNPILLIDEHDVKAGHGATVGRLEEVSLYYLMSRGLSRKEAELLMINGLLAPLVNEISDEPLKKRFQELVNERL